VVSVALRKLWLGFKTVGWRLDATPNSSRSQRRPPVEATSSLSDLERSKILGPASTGK